MRHHSDRSLIKGLLAGAVGGALGTVLLNGLQKASTQVPRVLAGKVPHAKRLANEQQELTDMFDVAHVKTAEAIAGSVNQKIGYLHRESAAVITEFAFGTLCAALYGTLAEVSPAITAGFGTVYGAVLFAGASELVLPALGFVPTPQDRTPSQHLGGLAGNVAYGAVTEAVRRLLRS